MMSSGIIRRIDDLGRIVIPKEIRKAMRLNDGDPVEIIPSKKGEIILRKYHASAINTDVIDDMLEELNDVAYYGNNLSEHDKAHNKVAKITEALNNVKKLIKDAGY